jgi:hypothetical protein
VEHVLWIGGAPGSGKTTIATALARRHGLRLYSSDTRTWVHRDRALEAGNESARRWEAMTAAERWEHSTPAEMLKMSLHRERGAMTVDDLRALPDSPLIVAEGSALPASAVSAGIAARSRAVWLLPTPEFQREQLEARGTGDGPARLYRLLGEVIEREAHDHRAPTLMVDGSRDIAEMVDAVDHLMREAIATGPRAGTRSERQRLLRDINENIAAQVRGYYARAWATGSADAVRRSFVCECGKTACDLDVVLSVAEVSDGPALALDHRTP